MQRIFRASMYAFLGLLVLFFFSVILGAGFPEESFISNFGYGIVVAIVFTMPFLFLTALVTGVGSLFQRNTYDSEKMKNDFLTNFDGNPERLQDIMNQLSPSDRAYLQQELNTRRLGVSNDGEMMSLDELLEADQEEDEGYNSLFTG